MTWLVVGLGNPGPTYARTRHNIGYLTVEILAGRLGAKFSAKLLMRAAVAEGRIGSEKVVLVKPTTFMNLSGNAVRYWLQQEKIDQKRLLVISDELALPLGAFRLKAGGSNGGHNGLGHIQQLIGQNYARLRMGIGNEYPRGGQVDWVLGKYTEEDMKELQPAIDLGVDIIKSFVLQGIDITMNQYNKLGKK